MDFTKSKKSVFFVRCITLPRYLKTEREKTPTIHFTTGKISMKRTTIGNAVLLMAFTFFALYGGLYRAMETTSWAAETDEQATQPAVKSTRETANPATKEAAKAALVPPLRSPHPKVLIVHGFQGQDQDFDVEISLLSKIYQIPKKTCEPWRWNAPEVPLSKLRKAWKKAIQDQQTAAENLFHDIQKMPKKEQQRLILVGHSLGGGVVIHALAKCQKENIKIDHFLLLGAAIDNDDPDIELALKATTHCSYNLANIQDYALGTYRFAAHVPTEEETDSNFLQKAWSSFLEHFNRITDGAPALGTGYSVLADETKLCELVFEMETSHDSAVYLENFLHCVEAGQLKSSEILVPQDWPYEMSVAMLAEWISSKLPDWGNWYWTELPWVNLEEKDGWLLQQGGISWGHIQWPVTYCRIRSPEQHTMAWGGKTRMTSAFEKVKAQLAKGVPPRKTNTPAEKAPAPSTATDGSDGSSK